MKQHLKAAGMSSVLLILTTCDTIAPTAIWDAEDTGGPAPVIAALSPPDTALAAVGLVTISGSNFSTHIDGNQVYFGSHSAQVLAASATELTVLTPIINSEPVLGDIADSLVLKLGSRGAFNFVEYASLYTLEYAAVNIGNPSQDIALTALAADNSDNLYFALGGRVVTKMTPDETETELGTATAKIEDMKMGSGTYIHFATGKTIQRLPPAGGTPETVGGTLPGTAYSFDFDGNGNILVGQIGSIQRINADGSVETAYTFSSIYYGMRAYDDNLFTISRYYGADTSVSKWSVEQFPITDASGSLATPTTVFDWDLYASGTSSEPTDLTFDSDGNMYITADGNPAVTVVPTDGSGGWTQGEAAPLYEGLLSAPVSDLSWGGDRFLYLNRLKDTGVDRALLRVNMGALRSAIYNGR